MAPDCKMIEGFIGIGSLLSQENQQLGLRDGSRVDLSI